MAVSGQRHAPAELYPWEKDHRHPLYRRLGGPHSQSGHRGYRKNPFASVGDRTLIAWSPARSQTLYRLSYPAQTSLNIYWNSFSINYLAHTKQKIKLNSGCYTPHVTLCFGSRVCVQQPLHFEIWHWVLFVHQWQTTMPREAQDRTQFLIQ
jgi:hypothetical protein